MLLFANLFPRNLYQYYRGDLMPARKYLLNFHWAQVRNLTPAGDIKLAYSMYLF